MKNIFLCCAIILSATCQAQFEHVFLRGGYQIGTATANNALFTYTPNFSTDPPSASFSNLRPVDLNTASIPISLEGIGENIYIDFGFALRRSRESSNITPLTGKEGEQFRFRLALGDYIGESFGILVGGQFHHNEMRLNYTQSQRLSLGNTSGGSGAAEDYYISHSGGWQYGLGAHLIFNHENILCARVSLMYDWIKDRGIPGNSGYRSYLFTGNSMMGEVGLFWMFDEDEDFGIAIHGGINSRTIEMGYEGESNSIPFVPDNTIFGYYGSISLCIPAVILGGAEASRTIITLE